MYIIKATLFSFFIFFSIGDIIAQTLGRCGTDELIQQKMLDPIFAQERILQEKKVSESMKMFSQASCAIPLIVPVVVHFEADTISDQCMIDATLAQIDQINADFASCNVNASLLCNWIGDGCTNFGGSAGPSAMPEDGACIQFCLADQNLPFTESTIGGYAITAGDYHSVYQDASSAWQGYFNVYVGSAGGYPGFVPYLSGASNPNLTVGATIRYDAWGANGFTPCEGVGTSTIYNSGASFTHEAGHWFGLGHTFEYAYGDTPPQINPNYGCPTVNTTSCTSSVGSDYSGNFMDYVDDDCMFTFTQEQVDIMVATAASQSLWATSSISCSVNYPPCGASQAGQCDLIADFEPANSEIIDICLDNSNTLSLKDLSGPNPTNWTWTVSTVSGNLNYSLSSTSAQNPVISFSGGATGVLNISLTSCNALMCETVVHTVTVNLFSGASCSTDCSGGTSELFSENFDSCTTPTGWTFTHTNIAGGNATVGTCQDGTNLIAFDCTSYPNSGPGNSSFSGCVAVIDDDNPPSSSPDGIACIVSPIMDLSACTSATLSYDWEHRFIGGSELFTQVSYDGASWVNVQSSQAVESDSESISLTAFTGTVQVRFCFDDAGGFFYGAAIDNVLVCGDCNTCADTLQVNNLISDNHYKAKLVIQSDGQVPSSGDVIMEAGQEIELQPSFEADQNSDLDVHIGGCP